MIFAFRELSNSRRDELAAIITAEHGKVHSDAVGEVARGQEGVEFACGISRLLRGGHSAGASTGVDVHSLRQALGVVGIISPFNFPAMVPMWFFPIAIAIAGAKLVVDGCDTAVRGADTGFWLGPTLCDHVTPDMEIHGEEIFGPVLSVVRVASYDDALALIDSDPHGNGAAIFTNDGGAARRFETDVEVGMIGVNVPVPVAYDSFGGWKRSLFGDTLAHGAEGVHFFTRGKVVTTRCIDPADRPAGGLQLGFPRND